MHADRAVHRVVEQQDDRPDPLACRGRQLLPGHHEAAVAAEADDQPVGMHQLRGDRRRHAIAHRAASRPELAARPAVLQETVRPTAKIAGV